MQNSDPEIIWIAIIILYKDTGNNQSDGFIERFILHDLAKSLRSQY